MNAEFLEGTAGFPIDTDNALQGIIGQTGHGNHRITGTQYAKQRYGQGMRTAGKAMAYQCIFGIQYFGKNGIKGFPSSVAVAVAGRSCKTAFTDTGLLKRMKHFMLVIFRDLIGTV